MARIFGLGKGFIKIFTGQQLILLLALLSLSLFSFSQDALARPNRKYASIVMDADTGAILSRQSADKVLHPASLTKMMTLVMLFEALDEHNIKMNDRITVSRKAASMVPSKLAIPAGGSITVKDAIYALVTKSANDVAVAIAERLGGSESNFSSMMTKKARDIGMSRTKFVNASGLHNKKQVTTARDMARLARYIIKNYPHYYHVFSARNFTYDGKTYRNHNHLMFTYEGMDGIKTGYVHASGFNLVASAKRNNHRLIGVVFGGRSSKTRNSHMARLMDDGFKKLEEMRMAMGKVPLPGKKPQVALLAAMDQKDEAEEKAALEDGSVKWASLNSYLSEGMISSIIGEGDYDPAQIKRFETGMIAVAAHKGESIPASGSSIPLAVVKASIGKQIGQQLADHLHNHKKPEKKPIQISYNTSGKVKNSLHNSGKWSVQIGAFTSRVATDQILTTALQSLPKSLSNSSPKIVPLRTGEGMIYRARLDGYSRSEASKVCTYLRNCITIAPE